MLSIDGFGAFGGKHKGHGVILNAQGQIVAHVFGHVKIIDQSYKFVPRKKGEMGPMRVEMKGVGDEDVSSMF